MQKFYRSGRSSWLLSGAPEDVLFYDDSLTLIKTVFWAHMMQKKFFATVWDCVRLRCVQQLLCHLLAGRCNCWTTLEWGIVRMRRCDGKRFTGHGNDQHNLHFWKPVLSCDKHNWILQNVTGENYVLSADHSSFCRASMAFLQIKFFSSANIILKLHEVYWERGDVMGGWQAMEMIGIIPAFGSLRSLG